MDTDDDSTEESLKKIRKRMAYRDMKPIGYCYNPSCNSELPGNRLFCCQECSDEWDELHRDLLSKVVTK